MHDVRSLLVTFIGHALHTAGAVLSWHPSPEVHFVGQVVHDLASSEAVRLWARTTIRVHWTRLTARLSRGDNR
ncbi:hypothetical protein WDV06_04710 [Streptomyces racemochromogenes]|uniref:Secreted protein n=1 Tax=Streptomyces racemochromogenes TaxID=67353 RepID=A0ABW7P7R9_9ACTN